MGWVDGVGCGVMLQLAITIGAGPEIVLPCCHPHLEHVHSLSLAITGGGRDTAVRVENTRVVQVRKRVGLWFVHTEYGVPRLMRRTECGASARA